MGCDMQILYGRKGDKRVRDSVKTESVISGDRRAHCWTGTSEEGARKFGDVGGLLEVPSVGGVLLLSKAEALGYARTGFP